MSLTSNDKPEFIDNRSDNTLASALNAHMDWLARTYAKPVSLSVASGYFNPEGFALLASRLRNLSQVRLLLGAEPIPPPAKPVRAPGDPRGARFEAKLVREAITLNAVGLVRDRDRIPFSLESDRSIRSLLELLDSGLVEVRRYEKAFLHGKAYVFAGNEGAVVGSSNFTAAGLTSNLELNLGRYDPEPVRRVQTWFEDLWAEAVPFDLAGLYRERFGERDPYLIYLRVLWELYKDELDEEQRRVGLTLTTFQKDGLWRARRILSEFNGVLIADGVGLGKTYIAGELIREALQERRQRVLLVTPAALRDGMWRQFKLDWQLPSFETISYEQLMDEAQVGGKTATLAFKPNEYAMVVIDESHAFRNPDALRAQRLRALLLGDPPKQVVLLTATPVNNSLWDLYYLLTTFVAHDGVFAERGVRSLKDKFKEAADQDPDDLRPDTLFDILDLVTVRRTRHFVKKYYSNEMITGPRGERQPVRFPDPHVERIGYDLDAVLPGFFDDIREALVGDEDEHSEPLLKMARYFPSAYRRKGKPEGSQLALVGLIRTGLLKRFESSVHAIATTATRMVGTHDAFLRALDQGWVPTAMDGEEWANVEDDEDFERLLQESSYKEPASAYDLKRLRADVESDRAILAGLARRATSVKAEKDPKLEALVKALLGTLNAAEDQGVLEAEKARNRKVIVFSYFADTVEWIHNHLVHVLASDIRLAPYRNRLVSVAGQESLHGVGREKAVWGFAPESTQAPPAHAQDRFDILLTTDVLAEGVNLQQARNIINYDLPWNPMRLVQRHGRIDRIGSPHKDVYVKCFFPDRRLDILLDLEARIRRKLAQAAASIGLESEVIPGAKTSDVVFAETRKEIAAIEKGDADLLERGGEDTSAHSGEEYRQELRQALLTRKEQIANLPWAAGSGLAQGPERGHFFLAKVGEQSFLRFVPFSGGPIERNTLKCLKRITCAPDTLRHLPENLAAATYDAWLRARDDVYQEWQFATDPKNIQPKVRPYFLRVAEHLRRTPPPDLPENDLAALLSTLEAPIGVRHERVLRNLFDPDDDVSPEKVKAFIAKVKELGLQPYKQPEPLAQIEKEEVALVCWMAVEAAE
ncbi:MAG: helicase [Candidatus Brocadiae bacterium]|nr:helicase [Candidatus Brocadiia bacterium]